MHPEELFPELKDLVAKLDAQEERLRKIEEAIEEALAELREERKREAT